MDAAAARCGARYQTVHLNGPVLLENTNEVLKHGYRLFGKCREPSCDMSANLIELSNMIWWGTAQLRPAAQPARRAAGGRRRGGRRGSPRPLALAARPPRHLAASARPAKQAATGCNAACSEEFVFRAIHNSFSASFCSALEPSTFLEPALRSESLLRVGMCIIGGTIVVVL